MVVRPGPGPRSAEAPHTGASHPLFGPGLSRGPRTAVSRSSSPPHPASAVPGPEDARGARRQPGASASPQADEPRERRSLAITEPCAREASVGLEAPSLTRHLSLMRRLGSCGPSGAAAPQEQRPLRSSAHRAAPPEVSPAGRSGVRPCATRAGDEWTRQQVGGRGWAALAAVPSRTRERLPREVRLSPAAPHSALCPPSALGALGRGLHGRSLDQGGPRAGSRPRAHRAASVTCALCAPPGRIPAAGLPGSRRWR